LNAAITPTPQPAAAAAALPTTGAYVASRTGTKYYLPTCGTAKRIKDENKVWFATKADAEKAGYEPATNCKGL
jgi:methylphosphotriester-DNA--protein-cysteine methyltransferase